MTLVAVATSKFAKGYDGTAERKAPEVYEIVDLRDALVRTYPSDAHLVTYVVEGATRQPRINKTGIAYFEKAATVGVFFCDVDNVDHAPWTAELHEAALEQYVRLDVLRSAGVYHTQHGRRIVQPVEERIPVQSVEPYLRRWLLELEAAGLRVDWACRDWTRHFRLPNVRRAGRAYASPYVDLERMAPIALAPLPTTTIAAEDNAPPRRRKSLPAMAWTSEVPDVWRDRVEPISTAVRAVLSEWHKLFLALAGALLSRGVPPEHVPALCRAISIATGADSKTNDREAAARSTVDRWRAGQPATGYAELRRSWPTVAEALDGVLARPAEARLRAQVEATVPQVPADLAATTAALEDVIRTAPDGLTLIAAECGLGKTACAMRVAAERARKHYASPDALGMRAPAQSKTSISVDKHELALQVVRDLAAEGITARRLFGPLSMKKENGTFECIMRDVALPLVDGGQPMQWELCLGRNQSPCRHFDACKARDGMEGPDDARVTVGPHALLPQLGAVAGTTGLLVIDEPPPALETMLISVVEFDVAMQFRGAFDGEFIAALTPALLAVRAWIANGEVGVTTTVANIVRGFGNTVEAAVMNIARRTTILADDADAIACARSAPFPPNRPGTAPPITFAHIDMARSSPGYAARLGGASRIFKVVYDALSSERPVAARLEEVAGKRVVVLTSAAERLFAAVKREGAVVVTDANIELHAPILAKVVGYEPPLHRFTAPDGAPITRTVLLSSAATRKSWSPANRFVLAPSLVASIRRMFAWAAEDPTTKTLGVITMPLVELAIRIAQKPTDIGLLETWTKRNQSKSVLEEIRSTLAPIVTAWPGEIQLGHYGAVRGLNSMADVDAVITLGDPWINLGDVRNDVQFLGLGDAWEARYEALCRAELEQAHGRIRAVHRRRPGRALHIGTVLPGGSGWSAGGVDVRRVAGGRGATPTAMSPQDFGSVVDHLGGGASAAAIFECSPSDVSRWRSGTRPIPPRIADVARNCATV